MGDGASSRLSRRLVTPEGVALHIELAGAGARAGAFVIDLLAMLGLLIGLTLLAVFGLWLTGARVPGLIAVLWLLGFFALRNFYFVAFETGTRAATPGKRMLRLRVVARDGGRLTAGAVLARNLLREVELFLPLSFLAAASSQGFGGRGTVLTGFAWTLLFLFFPLFNRDRLRAGDLIAGTWVVVVERRAPGVDLAAQVTDRDAEDFTAGELAVYGERELQRIEDVLRRNDDDLITLAAAAVARKTGRKPPHDGKVFLNNYYIALRKKLERDLLFGSRNLNNPAARD